MRKLPSRRRPARRAGMAAALALGLLLAAPPSALEVHASRDGARPPPPLEAAYALAEEGAFLRAAALLDRLARERPIDSEAHLLRAFIYRVLLGHFQRENYRKAFEESAAAALRLLGGRAGASLPPAERELRVGLVEGTLALRRFREGDYLEALRRGAEARRRFERALALDPGLSDAYLGIGLYNFWRNRVALVGWVVSFWSDTAAQGLREIRRAAEGRGRLRSLARVELASALFREERFEEGRQVLRALLRDHPRHVLYRIALAESYYRQKKWEEARGHFGALARELEKEAPDDPGRLYRAFARWRVARALAELGRKGEAARLALELSRVPHLDSRLLKEIRTRAAEMAREAGLLDTRGSGVQGD